MTIRRAIPSPEWLSMIVPAPCWLSLPGLQGFNLSPSPLPIEEEHLEVNDVPGHCGAGARYGLLSKVYPVLYPGT